MTQANAGLIVATLLGVVVTAQQPKPTFEVASIRKLAGPSQGFPRRISERGIFSIPSTTVAYLIQFAYEVRDDLMVGVPDWVRTDVFDVNAKAANEATADDMRPMMQSLLAERFGLVVRKQRRVMPHFLMRQVKAGVLGASIQELDDCTARRSRPAVPAGAATATGCGPMASVAALASRFVGAPVIDGTGLTGTFSYLMSHSPAEQQVIPGLPPLHVRIDPDAASNLPTFRQALQEQLGLRLESVRGPLEVLVIDSISQPTEN